MVEKSCALAHGNFPALVDVDSRGGGDALAHRLAHQVVVVVVHHRACPTGHCLVDADADQRVIESTFIDDLSVFNDMTQIVLNLKTCIQVLKIEQGKPA